jgi:Tol biopolymer transport system component
MSDHDEQLARWLELGPDRGPAEPLETVMGRIGDVPQRPAWLVGLRGGTIAARPVDRRWQLAAAAALVVLALVAGGLIATGGPGLGPDASAVVVSSDGPSPVPSVLPVGGTPDVIVYTETKELENGEEDCHARFHCFRSWVAIVNADGSGQRRLFPDAPPTQSVAAVSPDGRRVLVTGVEAQDGTALAPTYYLTDLGGATPTILDTGCAGPCVSDTIGSFAFSPDGGRLAFVRSLVEGGGGDPFVGDATVIAVMDLASSTVAELASTRASNPFVGMPCGYACGEGVDEAPRWSPDGRRLLFSRSAIGIPNQPRSVLDTKLFLVDADGSDLRQLVATELYARDAQWSPDGSLIVFTSAIETLTIDDFGKLEDWHQLNDLWTVRPDGSEPTRITSFTAGPVPDLPGDVGATLPTWTRDGRIVFTVRPEQQDDPPPWQMWVVDADGTDGTRIEPGDAVTLTGLGCQSCAYPAPDPRNFPLMGFWRVLP